MRLTIDNCRLLFDTVPGASVRSSHDLQGAIASIETSVDFVVVDQVQNNSEYRWITKYDLFGNQLLKMMFDSGSKATIQISADNTEFSIDGVPRLCGTPILFVFGLIDGEVVVLNPKHAPDQSRNIYRYNSDGSLRWQVGPRQFRASDAFWVAEASPNGNVLGRASLNGWSAEIDDATGEVLRIASTNDK